MVLHDYITLGSVEGPGPRFVWCEQMLMLMFLSMLMSMLMSGWGVILRAPQNQRTELLGGAWGSSRQHRPAGVLNLLEMSSSTVEARTLQEMQGPGCNGAVHLSNRSPTGLHYVSRG